MSQAAGEEAVAPFFWLHIKKSAGTSVRQLLQPHYRQVTDRVTWPSNFTQVSPAEYNDVLNNYRVVLGRYQFRRCQFARRFLYPASWDSLYKFAFVRNPAERAASMFTYLTRFSRFQIARSLLSRRPLLSTSSRIDYFLGEVERVHAADGSFYRGGLHFPMHVATMAGDVCDEDGRVMLDRIYRLEDLRGALVEVLETCGLDPQVPAKDLHLNRTGSEKLRFSAAQRRRVEAIFAADYELFESSTRL